MNLSSKTAPWMVASLLAVSSVFGQNSCQQKSAAPVCQPVKPTCQPQVCKPAKPAVCGVLQAPQMPTIAAYNAPAEINVGMQGEYDFFVSADFLYWQPLQDNMSVGLRNSNSLADIVSPGTGMQGNYIDMDFNYKPGFQVALGMNLQNDDWVGYAQYTRVHGRHTTSSSVPNTDPSIFATWGTPFLLGDASVYNQVNANFGCNLDFVDGMMERVYYVGQSLVFHSAFGARGSCITEKMQLQYNYDGATITGGSATAFPYNTNVVGRVHSWAVGPRTSLEMDWVLGDGFRFFGTGAADVLYTRYKVQDKTTVLARATSGDFVTGQTLSFVTKDRVSALRTHLDLEAGFGWGTYLDNNGWHVDFTVGYGFQVFFNQNMFQQYYDDVFAGAHTEEHGNLYIQGLNVSARLDF